MKLKRVYGVLLVCAVLVGCLGMSANAAGAASAENKIVLLKELDQDVLAPTGVEYGASPYVTRATISINVTVRANGVSALDESFPLESGETVTINAVYSPRSASVDFGLIAPDGLFHYINTTDGNIDKTIRVDQRGNYTFAVRNNSSDTISVSGFVNY